MLDLSMKYTSCTADDGTAQHFSISRTDYNFAIKYGTPQLLEKLIERTDKPNHYQGLSVYGQKRTDWATTGRRTKVKDVAYNHPPLLEAASEGNLQAVNQSLNDSPMSCYSRFAAANANDERITNLSKAPGDFEKAVAVWLSTRKNLVVHCAVLSESGPDLVQLLEYLVKAVPSSLDAKSRGGHTPLQLAFSLRRYEVAKVLIAAGADQTCRDFHNDNLIHSLLCPIGGPLNVDSKGVRELLLLIDPRLLASMFTERSSHRPGGTTPLSRWLYATNPYGTDVQNFHRRVIDDTPRKQVLDVLFEFCNGADLTMIDGAGDTPLHVAVKCCLPQVVTLMLKRNPMLLYHENATSHTPLEVAEGAYLAERLADPPTLPDLEDRGWPHSRTGWTPIVDRTPESFLEQEEDKRSAREIVYTLCKEMAQRFPGKRRLVSLFDANKVAKRLMDRRKKEQKSQKSGRKTKAHDLDDSEDEVDIVVRVCITVGVSRRGGENESGVI